MVLSWILSAKVLTKALSSITPTYVANVAAAKALVCSMAHTQEHADYFAMFGLQPAFMLGTAALAVTYRGLAKDVLPDRFSSGPAADQRQAVERAAQLNEAFQTLKSPTQRALYLLRRQADLPEETTIQDGEFLFQQMDLQQQFVLIYHLKHRELKDSLALAVVLHLHRIYLTIPFNYFFFPNDFFFVVAVNVPSLSIISLFAKEEISLAITALGLYVISG